MDRRPLLEHWIYQLPGMTLRSREEVPLPSEEAYEVVPSSLADDGRLVTLRRAEKDSPWQLTIRGQQPEIRSLDNVDLEGVTRARVFGRFVLLEGATPDGRWDPRLCRYRTAAALRLRGRDEVDDAGARRPSYGR